MQLFSSLSDGAVISVHLYLYLSSLSIYLSIIYQSIICLSIISIYIHLYLSFVISIYPSIRLLSSVFDLVL